MAKKIFSISIVKNEADIIESFVRYNLNILDGMVILDNQSSDDTLKILNLLKNEGLNVNVLKDEDGEFNQAYKINELLKYTIQQFEADIIVTLDGDEFIASPQQENPRKYLEQVEFPNYSLAKWRTYVPTFDNDNERFVPSRITHARDDFGEYYKVIIPRELVEKYDVKITKGNHKLLFDSKYNEIIQKQFNDDLIIAHYPIRSKNQFLSKITVGWINNITDVTRRGNDSWHLKNMYHDLIMNMDVKKEKMIEYAKIYSMKDLEKEVNIHYDPLNLSFCHDICIKYDVSEVNYIQNFLENTESLAERYFSMKREFKAIKKENRDISLKNRGLSQEKQLLEQKIREFEKSTSWRITAPMRKFTAFLKKLKNN